MDLKDLFSDWISIDDAIRRLKLSVSSIRKLRKGGILLPYECNCTKITKDSFERLDEFLKVYRSTHGSHSRPPIDLVIKIFNKKIDEPTERIQKDDKC